MKKIEKLKGQLEKYSMVIQELEEHRENIFDNRTCNWQDSEKGEIYSDKTYNLNCAYEALEEAITELNNFLEE